PLGLLVDQEPGRERINRAAGTALLLQGRNTALQQPVGNSTLAARRRRTRRLAQKSPRNNTMLRVQEADGRLSERRRSRSRTLPHSSDRTGRTGFTALAVPSQEAKLRELQIAGRRTLAAARRPAPGDEQLMRNSMSQLAPLSVGERLQSPRRQRIDGKCG